MTTIEILNGPHRKLQHEATSYVSQFGMSSVRLTCPFCGESVIAYVWSLAGTGKRCPCGAMHFAGGTSIRRTGKAKAGQERELTMKWPRCEEAAIDLGMKPTDSEKRFAATHTRKG